MERARLQLQRLATVRQALRRSLTNLKKTYQGALSHLMRILTRRMVAALWTH